jgi:aspartyl-tRNA(Asn)/glutamyl-tRNA(Gln) amidotransferase subunit C
MPASTTLDIDKLAVLARIELTPAEREKFSGQLGDVLKYVGQLEQVDITGIEPTAHGFPISNVWSEDTATPTLPVEEVLRNAPAQRDNMIVVPKVVE